MPEPLPNPGEEINRIDPESDLYKRLFEEGKNTPKDEYELLFEKVFNEFLSDKTKDKTKFLEFISKENEGSTDLRKFSSFCLLISGTVSSEEYTARDIKLTASAFGEVNFEEIEREAQINQQEAIRLRRKFNWGGEISSDTLRDQIIELMVFIDEFLENDPLDVAKREQVNREMIDVSLANFSDPEVVMDIVVESIKATRAAGLHGIKDHSEDLDWLKNFGNLLTTISGGLRQNFIPFQLAQHMPDIPESRIESLVFRVKTLRDYVLALRAELYKKVLDKISGEINEQTEAWILEDVAGFQIFANEQRSDDLFEIQRLIDNLEGVVEVSGERVLPSQKKFIGALKGISPDEISSKEADDFFIKFITFKNIVADILKKRARDE